MTSIGTKFGHISFQGQVITTNTGSQVEIQTSEAIMSESTKCENYVTVAGRFTATGGGRNKLVAALDNAHIISVSTKLSTVRLQKSSIKDIFFILWVSFANCLRRLSRQNGCECTCNKILLL